MAGDFVVCELVGVDISGSEALRRHPSFRSNIANGDFVAVASLLNRTNLGTTPPPLTNGGLLHSSGLFPENFFVVNPQFSAIQYRNNAGKSNYHSLETQVTLRPTHGITYQATYTWSRGLALIDGYRDLMNQNADYTLQSTHRTHDLRSYMPQQYQRVSDPGCAQVAPNLTRWCTNTALADANGNIVLRNAAPGELGSLGLRTIEGPGDWRFDANIEKGFQIDESRRLTLRVDAQNVFNHPTPGNPNFNLNSGTFGEIRSKTGNRALQAQIHLEF